jgi:hypothetical protein
MTVKTSFDYPPIPVRHMDWSAWDDDTYDASYEGEEDGWKSSPIGHGATEQEAIDDLLEQISSRAT